MLSTRSAVSPIAEIVTTTSSARTTVNLTLGD